MGSRSKRRSRQAQQLRTRQISERQAARDNPAEILQQQISVQKHWQGPLPAPEDLEAYERVQPGFAERIVAMAEKAVEMADEQMKHRHRTEHRMITAFHLRSAWGLASAALLSGGALAGGIALLFAGHTAGGVAVVGIDMGSLAGVFVYGRYDQHRREREREG